MRTSAWLLVLPLFTLGCAQRRTQDYIPSVERSRTYLTRALEAWQNDSEESLESGAPLVRLADSHRTKGQRLIAFEILGEPPADDGRRLAVKLQLENPEAEEEVTYVIIGIDPIWIFRLEDYELVTHWEHRMTTPKAETTVTNSAEGNGSKQD